MLFLYSLTVYPDANYLVILEEDLYMSVDILRFFKQLLPVLENDESVYCLSAWNDQVIKLSPCIRDLSPITATATAKTRP